MAQRNSRRPSRLRWIPAATAASVLSALGCASTGSEPHPAAVASAPPAPAPAPAPPPVAPETRSLYARLGGEPAVAATVDEFLKRVAADRRINGRFMNTDLAKLRGLLIEFVCGATGGPCRYSGRDMHAAHAGMQIVDEEFAALVEDLSGALVQLGVPKPERDELLAALGPLGKQVVDPPPPGADAPDPALAKLAGAKILELRGSGKGDVADLLEAAVTARLRGQRSYADQLYSAAEARLPDGDVTALDPLFRAGAPERITTKLTTLPADSPPQPQAAVGASDDDDAGVRPKRGALAGTMRLEGSGLGSPLGVIALDPVTGKVARRKPKQRTMEQRDRQFAPRLLAIPVGSTVTFPNFDPIFHNVFSLSPARAFDLGIYKNGETRGVTFAREGIVRIGCNLHANMSAHLVVVAAPHYAVTDTAGRFRFRSLAPGKYRLRAWTEDSTEPLTQIIQVRAGDNALELSVPAVASAGPGTDKFGHPRGKTP